MESYFKKPLKNFLPWCTINNRTKYMLFLQETFFLVTYYTRYIKLWNVLYIQNGKRAMPYSIYNCEFQKDKLSEKLKL